MWNKFTIDHMAQPKNAQISAQQLLQSEIRVEHELVVHFVQVDPPQQELVLSIDQIDLVQQSSSDGQEERVVGREQLDLFALIGHDLEVVVKVARGRLDLDSKVNESNQCGLTFYCRTTNSAAAAAAAALLSDVLLRRARLEFDHACIGVLEAITRLKNRRQYGILELSFPVVYQRPTRTAQVVVRIAGLLVRDILGGRVPVAIIRGQRQ